MEKKNFKLEALENVFLEGLSQRLAVLCGASEVFLQMSAGPVAALPSYHPTLSLRTLCVLLGLVEA